MRRWLQMVVVLGVVACVLAVSAGQWAFADPGSHPYVADKVIIKFKKNATAAEKQAIKADLRGQTRKSFNRIGAELLDIEGLSVEEAVNRYKHHNKVEYIEPDYIVEALEIPDDAFFDQLWGMLNTGQTGGTADADIDADLAWEVGTGSHDVLVGVIDTGVDYNHTDLAANTWTNPGEIPGNGIDDDGNGFIDDIKGWDFYNDDSDPLDDHGHGTHCSGTIGAVGNNGIGVAGVNWSVSIAGIKFLSAGGSGSTSDAIDGINYGITIGCKVLSNSWGGGGYSAALEEAIQDAYDAGILFVAAAGNSSANTDISPHYPSSYDVGNIVAVAATDHNDNLSSFSNYGALTVDIGAPGSDIYSTLTGNSYGYLSGTSMATPHVAGVAALIWSLYPGMTVDLVKTRLMDMADPIPALTGKCVSGARLNAFMSIAEPDDTPPAAITDLATFGPGSNTMGLSWSATGDDGTSGTASYYNVRYSTSPITEANWTAAIRVGNEPDPGPYGWAEEMEVGWLDFSTTYYFAVKAFDEFGNASPISNIAMGTTLGAPDIAYAPGSFTESLLTGGTSMQALTLSNEAEGTLDFSIPGVQFVFSASAPGDYLEVAKGDADPRPGILGTGGPDGHGYRWIDSDHPGGPVFSWIDAAALGSPIALSGDDSNAGPFPIGFDFPFYDSVFDEFRICTNGFISFTSSSSPYSNQPLPNSGAPENLIAPFWDDQTFSGNQAYMYYDGTKLVIQFDNVAHYSAGGPYTYEVILYPSGKIMFQYLSMAEPTNSATVGIQNETKDDGLQVAFNAPYVHDGLAVQLMAVPQWLDVTPTSGRILAGGDMMLDVHFDAAGLMGGDYDANIVIESNDPDEGMVLIPATLHVTGAPDISVNPAALDFGEIYLGYPSVMTVTITNDGTDDLTVSNVYTGTSEFTVAPVGLPWTITAGGGMMVDVTFDPAADGSYTDVLTVDSDDSDEATVTVDLSGSAVIPPDIFVDPTSLHSDLNTGETEDHDLTLSNSGGVDYDWTAAVSLITATDVVVYESLDLGKDEVDPRPGILGSGGPDAYGYRWSDSDEPGGPAFNWVDITGVGTPVAGLDGDDETAGPISIGFDFPFYGDTYNQVYLSTNGFATLTSPTSSDYSNDPLPSSYGPRALLAPWWDDHNFYGAEHAYTYNDGGRFIIEYHEAQHYGGTGTYTYQIILYPDGSIVYQYLTMTGLLNSATIGIQNYDRDDGLQVVYNSSYIHDDMAIRIAATPQWLTVSPPSGTLPPDGDVTITAHISAAGMEGGDYEGEIVITGADPLDPSVTVPVTLHVTGAPDVAVTPESVDFGLVYMGYSTLRDVFVQNNGTDVLHVTDVTSTHPDFSVDVTDFDVPPHGQQLLTARFSPSSVGTAMGELHVMSDDGDTPDLAVPVQGLGLVAPDIDVSPMSVFSDLLTGELESHPVTVQNTGGSDLDFTAAASVTGDDIVVHAALDLGKDDPDPRMGFLGSGGPDAFGYLWADSDEPGGPAFDWVDISGVGTPIPGLDGDDEVGGPVAIGFDFPFYGNTFNQIWASTNGWATFTSTTSSDLSNDPLPSSGGPQNLLAMFWDDLHFRYVERALYYYDGSRFILTYEHVTRYAGSSDDLNFQVILYPNGTIIYQYLTMDTATLNSCTIGIQNEMRDDGLQVVYNADYLHDNMAIRIATTPQWITVLPESGTIPPGGSATLSVTLDATGMFGGDYYSTVEITSNDPDEGLVGVAAHLHVTGVPDIGVDPLAMDMGTVYLGFSSQHVMTVTNEGTDLLSISDIMCNNADFTVDMTAFDLDPLSSRDVTVTFAPSAAGERTGTMTVYSNDADEPEVEIAMSGTGLVPPEIVADPDSIHAAVHPDVPRTKTLQICNTGGSDLEFDLSSAAVTVTAYDFLDPGKGEDLDGAEQPVDPRPGILGSGGPDAFGYTWKDSDEPGGPVYDWVDISGVGTPVGFSSYQDDGNVGPIPIGFDFDFYGNTFNQFYVCTNGWISFTSTRTTYSNQPLPNTGSAVPENLLAVFWDDMVYAESYDSEALYYNDGSRLIMQYTLRRIANYTPPWYTFQVILYPNGKIVYQYHTLGSTTNSCTIGIQNAAKDDGLTVAYNAGYVHEGLAIEFSTAPDWFSVSPETGTVPAGECVDLTVSFNAAGMENGEYNGEITINSNDPYNPVITVPVHMLINVIDLAYLNVDPNTLNLQVNGNYVMAYMEPPSGYDASDILVETVLFEYEVPALTKFHEIGDDNNNHIDDMMTKFLRSEVELILSGGDSVPVTVVGEIEDVAWFTGTDYIRVIKPAMSAVSGTYIAGQFVDITWTPPADYPVDYYGLYYTTDGGEWWYAINEHFVGTRCSWRVPAVDSDECLFRVYAYDSKGAMGYDTCDGFFSIRPRTGGGGKTVVPEKFAMFQNNPNPAIGTTSIAFNLPAETMISLKIFDVTGALIKTLVDRPMPAGRHSVVWNGTNGRGAKVGAGVYFYSIEAGDHSATKKLILVQ